MFYYVWWKRGSALPAQPRPIFKGLKPLGGARPDLEFLPNTTDWLGRWRLAANASNDWRIDREAQRTNAIYSGIDNIHLQDQAVTESMGPITDHGFEHLAPSDQMVTRTRRRLLIAARALREQDTLPPASRTRTFFARRAAGSSSAKTRVHGRRSMPSSWPPRCARPSRGRQPSRRLLFFVAARGFLGHAGPKAPAISRPNPR